MQATAIIQTVSVAVAAFSVVIGISSWRRSEVGKRKIDLAEEVLKECDNIRSAFKAIRSPFSFADEPQKKLYTDYKQELIPDHVGIALSRVESHSDKFSGLRSYKPRFSAYFGNHVSSRFDDALKLRDEISRAAFKLGRFSTMAEHKIHAQRRENYSEEVDKLEAIIWEVGDIEDPFSKRINDCMGDIEKACRLAIGSEPNFWQQARAAGTFLKSYFAWRV